jgi:hypothetical protein
VTARTLGHVNCRPGASARLELISTAHKRRRRFRSLAAISTADKYATTHDTRPHCRRQITQIKIQIDPHSPWRRCPSAAPISFLLQDTRPTGAAAFLPLLATRQPTAHPTMPLRKDRKRRRLLAPAASDGGRYVDANGEPEQKMCPCNAGICLVRESGVFRGRKYYTCPMQVSARCSMELLNTSAIYKIRHGPCFLTSFRMERYRHDP